ncbi:MAG: type VI secretion system baseplate subunit TssF [Acidobacteria bacterium]|nr:type VI secretion system baseplate subunit TssF [Acidobacteriota bacterium]
MRDDLLDYYERELIFLRRMGAEFSRKYPKVASRLLIDEEKIEDPHVERMVEAFAFLAGRVRIKLDDEFPEMTESFLNIIYPHYLAPIPSMAVTQFLSGSPKNKITTIQQVERGAKLYSRPIDGAPCRFRTSYDVALTPIEVLSAELESIAPPNAQGKLSDCQIRIKMQGFGGVGLYEMQDSETGEPIENLRFYLNGDPQLVFPLYELIFNHVSHVEIQAKETPIAGAAMQTMTNMQLSLPDPVILNKNVIRPVGFEEKEAMLPYNKKSFPGYRLLTEYFAFPYKFLFFDVHGFDQAAAKKFGSNFDLVIHLKDVIPPRAPIEQNTFMLGCTPIINLFDRTADPVYLSQQKYEYQIYPDVHHQTSTEVYSIGEVYTTDSTTNTTREFLPFYSTRHLTDDEEDKVYWYANRRASQKPEDNGTEMFITLVDLKFDPRVPAEEVITIKCTCTNRDLPSRLPFGRKEGDFEIEGTALVSRIRCLTKPTDTIRPARRRGAHWRLISHLNLNYLSLIENQDGTPEALQEMLQLYNFGDSSATHNQILGITGIESKKVVRKIGRQIGAGFVRGIETTLEFDEEKYVGSGLFLFASVLERFLGLYSSLNSFNQLVIKTEQKEDVVKRWPPRTGDRVLL